jgi:hypothetical protein
VGFPFVRSQRIKAFVHNVAAVANKVVGPAGIFLLAFGSFALVCFNLGTMTSLHKKRSLVGERVG